MSGTASNANASTAESSRLLRWGIARLAAYAQAAGTPADEDGVHHLNAAEQAVLRSVERTEMLRAATTGLLSSGACAVAEAAANAWWSERFALYWSVVGGVTLIATLVELAYLYVCMVRALHRLAHAAGLDVRDGEAAISPALVRAVFELPNPRHAPLGIDALREAPPWRLLMAALAYKGKIALTSVALKLAVRRFLSRAAVRTWLPFVSVPVTMAWNVIVTHRLLHEARIRAMGPSAVVDFLDALGASHTLSAPTAAAGARAVARCIVHTEDAHPNLVFLLDEWMRRYPPPLDAGSERPARRIDDAEAFWDDFSALTATDRRTVLRVLTVASIIDGRLATRECVKLRRARALLGLSTDLSTVKDLRRAFTDGRWDARNLDMLTS